MLAYYYLNISQSSATASAYTNTYGNAYRSRVITHMLTILLITHYTFRCDLTNQVLIKQLCTFD